MLSKLTKVVLSVDGANRNISDTDLLEANERYHPAPPLDSNQESQWSYKEALVALKAGRVITQHQQYLSEKSTTFVYSQNTETLSANTYYGGQNISSINYNNPNLPRTRDFNDVVGRNTQNRLFDAKNLIEDNKTWIASAPSVTDASSPIFSYTKCVRDITFFLEAIAYNLSEGGNNRVYDYALISREALLTQAQNEGRTIEQIAADYKIAINGDGTLESVRSRLESVINGSADVNNDGVTLLESTGITEAEDNCIDVVSSAHTFLDLLLLMIELGVSAPVARTTFKGNRPIGEGRLNDAAKLITDPTIKQWITNPPSINDTTKFAPSKCPRDLGYFIDAIAYNLVRGGNSQVYDYAIMSRTSLENQVANGTETRTYDELLQDYMLAFNGSPSKVGLRDRLREVVQGTAIINGTPLDISSFDITPASDLCSDVVSAINTYLDIILLIFSEGNQAVKRSDIISDVFTIPDNREVTGNIYSSQPYSYNGNQIAKCLRDVKYYIRYITYGLVANDYGIIDELFLNGLVEVNKAFNLDSGWYRTALDSLKDELTSNKNYYFSSEEQTYTMPSNNSISFSISIQNQLDKALEFINYVQSRI